MARFTVKKQRTSLRTMFLSILVFLGILFLFSMGVSSLSDSSDRKQEAALRSAITESAVHCYAIKGCYPKNLETLVEDYGITYDTEHFFVDYQPQGENIMPEITVVRKGE